MTQIFSLVLCTNFRKCMWGDEINEYSNEYKLEINHCLKEYNHHEMGHCTMGHNHEISHYSKEYNYEMSCCSEEYIFTPMKPGQMSCMS